MKWGLVLVVVSFFVSVLVIAPRKELASLRKESDGLKRALALDHERLRITDNGNSPEMYAANAEVEFRSGNYEFACQCLDLLMSDKSPPDVLVFKDAPVSIYCNFVTNIDHASGSPAEEILKQSFNVYTNEICRAVMDDTDNCRNDPHNLSNSLETLRIIAHRATNETVFIGQVISTVESLQAVAIRNKQNK